MFGFFRRTQTRKMQSPPAELPQRAPRQEWTTEVYNRTVYTPMLESQDLPGVQVAETAMNWWGRSAGMVVTIPATDGSGIPNTTLTLGGVQH